MQIFGIGHTFSPIFVLPSTYLSTNSLEWGPCEIKIYLSCGSDKSLHVILLGVAQLLQDVCIADIGQKKISYTTFGPWQPKPRSFSSYFVSLGLALRQDILPKEQYNRVHPAGTHSYLMNLNHVFVYLSRFT